MSIELNGIAIYPVKSLAGIDLESAEVLERGLRHDRRLMITDESGMCLTQRDIPSMATVRTQIVEGGIRLEAPDGRTLDLTSGADANGSESKVRSVEVWGDVCEAADLGDAAAEFLSDVLGKSCRLVEMPKTTYRPVSERFGRHSVSFADGYPLLIAGESSLAQLNERLAAPLPMNRFRPNLVVSGSEPFEEDSWKRIRIGSVEFLATKPCARCVVTTIDQKKGEKTGKEPLKTLAEFRSAKDVIPERYVDLGMNPGDVLFGMNLIPVSSGSTMQTGSEVLILERF